MEIKEMVSRHGCSWKCNEEAVWNSWHGVNIKLVGWTWR
jgi:hypothetical protein